MKIATTQSTSTAVVNSTPATLTSACRFCRFYQPDGLRQGICEYWTAPVKGDWQACQVAAPAFSADKVRATGA